MDASILIEQQKFSKRFISSIDGILTGTTSPDLNVLKSNSSNLFIHPNNRSRTETSPLDALHYHIKAPTFCE